MARTQLSGTTAFYAIVVGQFTSTMGSAITRFGLSVWVFTETGSTSAYTTLMFFAVFSVGMGALIAGPLVDRWNRRTVMIVSDTIAGLSTLAIAILYFTGNVEMWQIYAAVSINGVASAFSRPAFDASAALLVPRETMSRASGIMQLSGALEMVLSSAIAGLLVGVLGLAAVFVIDFITFAVNILLLLVAAIPQPQQQGATRPFNGYWKDYAVGLAYVRERPGLTYLLTLFTATMFLLPGVAYSLIAPLVLNIANEESLGFILSVFGVGSAVGATLMTIRGGFKRRMNGILVGMTAAGGAAILISLTESLFLIGASFFITGLGFALIMGLSRVIWQTKAPPQVLGRIFALQMALGVGAQSIGVLLTGRLADSVFEPRMQPGGALAGNMGTLIGVGNGRGIALMFFFVGVCELLLVLYATAQPSVRLLEDSLPDTEPPPVAAAIATEALPA